MPSPFHHQFIRAAWVTVAAACLALTSFGCAHAKLLKDSSAFSLQSCRADRELRAVYVSSAYNLDWPDRPQRSLCEQIAQIKAIVARAKEVHCNTIILQARSFADRIYVSSYTEGWAAALSNGSDPGYDPLSEWIHAAHAAGLELHVWINPFRTTMDDPNTTDTYVAQGQRWYKFNTAALQDHIINEIVPELLKYKASPAHICSANGVCTPALAGADSRTAPLLMANHPTTGPGGGDEDDIDGIHIDHYVPPPDGGGGGGGGGGTQPSTQPVAHAMSAVLTSSTTLSPAPATKRRFARMTLPTTTNFVPLNADDFIHQIYLQVAKYPNIKFGLSPRKDQIGAYNWLKNGDCHYMVPEIYGENDDMATELAKWWPNMPDDTVTPFKPTLAPGVYTARIQKMKKGTGHLWKSSTIEKQVKDARDYFTARRQDQANQNKKVDAFGGQAHYSYSALRSPAQGGPSEPEAVGEHLRQKEKPNKPKGHYDQPALVPNCLRVDPLPGEPGKPILDTDTNTYGDSIVRLNPKSGEDRPRLWEVWIRDDQYKWQLEIHSGQLNTDPGAAKAGTEIVLPPNYTRVKARAVDRYSQESDLAG